MLSTEPMELHLSKKQEVGLTNKMLLTTGDEMRQSVFWHETLSCSSFLMLTQLYTGRACVVSGMRHIEAL